MDLILIILLILLLCGGGWGFHAGWSGGPGILFVVLIVLLVLYLVRGRRL